MRLQRLFGVLSAVLVVVALAASALLIFVSTWMDRAARNQDRAMEGVYTAMELKSGLLAHEQALDGWKQATALAKSEEMRAAEEEILSALQGLRVQQLDEGDRALFERAREQIAGYFELIRSLAEAPFPGSEALEDTQLERAVVAADRMVDANRAKARTATARVERLNRQANALGISMAVVLLLAVPSSLLIFRAYALRPIAELRAAVSAYRPGRRAQVRGARELQEIAEAHNDLTSRLERQRDSQLAFIAAVAHELRNPLNAMTAAGALLRAEAARCEGASLLRGAERMSRQVERLNRMVDDLLDTARIESGQLALEAERVDLSGVVRESVELHRPLSAGHTWTLQLPEAPLWAWCDPTRITQVLHNLLSNALKYSPEGGEIRVSAAAEAGELRIVVEDDGVGISPAEVPRIFEPFRRSRETREAIPGVGLGLAVSQRIATAHGGEIEVTSRPGEGSRFTLRMSSDALAPRRGADGAAAPALH